MNARGKFLNEKGKNMNEKGKLNIFILTLYDIILHYNKKLIKC